MEPSTPSSAAYLKTTYNNRIDSSKHFSSKFFIRSPSRFIFCFMKQILKLWYNGILLSLLGSDEAGGLPVLPLRGYGYLTDPPRIGLYPTPQAFQSRFLSNSPVPRFCNHEVVLVFGLEHKVYPRIADEVDSAMIRYVFKRMPISSFHSNVTLYVVSPAAKGVIFVIQSSRMLRFLMIEDSAADELQRDFPSHDFVNSIDYRFSDIIQFQEVFLHQNNRSIDLTIISAADLLMFGFLGDCVHDLKSGLCEP
ncbi:hypothetical protein ACJIZ3_001360 [Penstemon smallii]|uniref:Uncharacterized protein n=1 Tax=Penstemon smallii TaxID=265156 RepID=A0ABD3U4F8_9LAMI